MHTKVKKSLAVALISCGFIATYPLITEANLLEEIQVRPDNYTNVVRVQLNGRIHIERQSRVGKSNVVLVYFQVLENKQLELTAVESLRSKPVDLLPGVTVSLGPQPNQKTRTLELRFSKTTKPITTTIQPGADGKSIDIIFGKNGKAEQSIDTKRYAITLLRSGSKDEISGKVIPQNLQDYDVFTSQQTTNGTVLYELNLGYFTTTAEANRALRKVQDQFPQASITDLAKRRTETLDKLAEKAKIESRLDQAQQAAERTALPEVEDQAAALMPKAKEALEAGNYELAINTLNQLLLLPPNANSQEAQELVGVARERYGELGKAKTEYELYLKLFPEGPGAERVREHLTALGKIAIPTTERRTVTTEGEPVSKSISGSLEQTYYGGKTLTQTPFDTPTTPGTTTISTTDQSELRTNINVSGAYRDETSAHKLYFEDDNSRSFIDTRPNRNRLRALNYEYSGLQNGVGTIIGRQSGSRLLGVPNRFDGATLSYNFSRKLSTSLVAGLPVDFPALKPDRKFLAANVNGQNFGKNWGFGAFAIYQDVDGITDREAVGGSLAYIIKPENSVSAYVDYDVSYNLLNIGMLQGNFLSGGGTSYTFYLDRRLTPFLSTTNALFNAAVTATPPAPVTIKELLLTRTEDEIRALATGTTAVAYQGALGFTRPLNEQWKVGNDFNWSRTGALPGVTLEDGTVLPPTPASGDTFTYSIKAIGTNLMTSSDINVFSLSLNKSPTVRGATLLYNNTTDWNQWTFKPVLQIQRQHIENPGDVQDKNVWTPDMTVSYRIKDSLSLQAEYTFEYTSTDSSLSGKETSKHHFFSLGYHWDF